MKLSKLIERLQKIRDEEGDDAVVQFVDPIDCNTYPIRRITVCDTVSFRPRKEYVSVELR